MVGGTASREVGRRLLKAIVCEALHVQSVDVEGRVQREENIEGKGRHTLRHRERTQPSFW
jgi:hypothetical protein